VRRFIAVFYPDCEFASTVVNANVETGGEEAAAEEKPQAYEFKATGKQILSEGWRVLFPAPAAKSEAAKAGGADSDAATADTSEGTDASDAPDAAEKENVLPEYKEGESGPHTPSVAAKQTQPPRYMSEGDLLRAMETAGNQVDDEELRDLMKENGIGRPSTRAAIIETLIKRQYIRKEKKRIVPTPLGMALIDIIPNDLLKSAELTGQWEKKLKQISEGNYPVRDFMAELKQMVVEVTWQVMQAERKPLGEEGQA
ncbi:MAG: hypothetical protein K2H70_06060, partial [Bacteroidales bacterium]|nr:hypothetical protein [Bacteroidales bacterium]